jgi:hypothetical protein
MKRIFALSICFLTEWFFDTPLILLLALIFTPICVSQTTQICVAKPGVPIPLLCDQYGVLSPVSLLGVSLPLPPYTGMLYYDATYKFWDFLDIPYFNPSLRGTFICTSGGSITVSNTLVYNSDIVITLDTVGGTITTPPAFNTITTNTGFSVLCGITDTSTYKYLILTHDTNF